MLAVAPKWLNNDNVLQGQLLSQTVYYLTDTNTHVHTARIISYSLANKITTILIHMQLLHSHIVCVCVCVCVCMYVCVFYESVFTLWLLLMPFCLPAAHKGIIMGQRWLRLALWQTQTHTHTHTRVYIYIYIYIYIYTYSYTDTYTHSLFLFLPLLHKYTFTRQVCCVANRHADGPFCLSLIQTHTHMYRHAVINHQSCYYAF